MYTLKTNLDALIEKLKKRKDQLNGIDYSAALLQGANASMGEMKVRIFNDGKDKSGVVFGKYTGKKKLLFVVNAEKIRRMRIAEGLGIDDGFTDYEKKRLKAGRQVTYKDLEFTGDLRRGVVIGKDSETRIICWIPNDDLFKIAKYQEEQIGKIKGQEFVVIFSLSDDERKTLKDQTRLAIKQLLQ